MKKRIIDLIDYVGKYTGTCPITLHEIEKAVVTECDHIFEKEALISWIQQSNECPVCRTKLNVVMDENDEEAVMQLTNEQLRRIRYILDFDISSESSSSSSSSSSTSAQDFERSDSASSSDYSNETSSDES